ncbi:unnamed protein product [Schistocephalus solidus]|uniref:Rab-like protein 3 n=1 Tax=Schistocephalus solidus TaxID=70667 RepID=A0A183TLG2_SCHSO|nr:unnamed protein product [Schistocephalus solidus]
MQNFGRVKIVVAGDSGVGKTAFVHLLSQKEVLLNPSWTVGCSVEIMLYDGPPMGDVQKYFIELWDIGGSAGHKNARYVFYDNIQGIILVHDLTNKKSELHLSKWLNELIATDSLEVICHSADGNASPEATANSRTAKTYSSFDLRGFWRDSTPPPVSRPPAVPILVVGTKMDLAGELNNTSAVSNFVRTTVVRQLSSHPHIETFGGLSQRSIASRQQTTPIFNSTAIYRSSPIFRQGSFAAQRGFREILLNCNDPDNLGPESPNNQVISDFLNEVNESCFFLLPCYRF